MSLFSLYLRNVFLAADCLLNAILGGRPDETISRRCAHNLHKPHWRIVGIVLEYVDPGHLKWDDSHSTKEESDAYDAGINS